MRWGKWQLTAIGLGVLAIAGMLLLKNHLASNTSVSRIEPNNDGDEVGPNLLPDDLSPGLLAMYRSVKADESTLPSRASTASRRSRGTHPVRTHASPPRSA